MKKMSHVYTAWTSRFKGFVLSSITISFISGLYVGTPPLLDIDPRFQGGGGEKFLPKKIMLENIIFEGFRQQ